MYQTLRWFIASGVLIAGVIANYLYQDTPASIRLVVGIALFTFALFVWKGTDVGQRLTRFFKDARMELAKVVWPSRGETINATWMVMLLVTISAVFFWLIDALLLKLIGYLTGYGAN